MLIIPTPEAKNHKYFLDLVNTSSETVPPHSWILPGTAGLWPVATVPRTLPQGLFPQTLIKLNIAYLIVL